MEVRKTYFGITKDSKEVYKFTLVNNKATRVEIINYGATIISFNIKDKTGNIKDIVLGYDTLAEYEAGVKYFGATIGRHANRIEGSSFKLNDKIYKLDKNEGDNQLHGGAKGFQKRVWDYEVKNRSVIFSYTSEDGEEGYPGKCILKVEFLLNNDNELQIKYSGRTNKDTVLNPTNHSYFNLNGHNNGDILKHKIQVNAKHYLPIDYNSIPLGEKKAVKDTIFDLNISKTVEDLVKNNSKEIISCQGLDHNYCMDENSKDAVLTSTLENENKTLKLLTYTDLPGIQIYTGNFIGDERGKNGSMYKDYSGICLETQYYPNSINTESFESPILRAEDEFKSTTIYKLV